MINRTLIRLKTVQMLYSYFLTHKDFEIQSEPAKNTKDSKSAYELYLNLLFTILKLSGYKDLRSFNATAAIETPQLAKILRNNTVICDIINKGGTSLSGFDSLHNYLFSAIIKSKAYKDLKKNKTPQVEDESAFWIAIINTLFVKDSTILDAALQIPGFTQLGYQDAIKMVTDTLSSCSDSAMSLPMARKALQASLEKSYELYHALVLLMVEITHAQNQRLEAAKDKYLPTAEELNPDLRFVENKFIQSIEQNEQMAEYLKTHPISWSGDIYLVKELLDNILSSEIYSRYMSQPCVSYADDCELWRQILKNIILPSDMLAETLEMKSVYWNDDLEIMSTFVSKTIKQFAAAGSDSPGLLPMYKDEEDANFAEQLFTDTARNQDAYFSYITRFVNREQWETERIPLMDTIIIMVIISELVNFPLIPLPVTINEYIEIANRYSSPKSSIFINGIITNIIKALREEGKIQK